jgi:hypothetical protein
VSPRSSGRANDVIGVFIRIDNFQSLRIQKGTIVANVKAQIQVVYIAMQLTFGHYAAQLVVYPELTRSVVCRMSECNAPIRQRCCSSHFPEFNLSPGQMCSISWPNIEFPCLSLGIWRFSFSSVTGSANLLIRCLFSIVHS